ncbi:7373_t:CDS:10 [Paraglomus brasilianum]|uniref:7373_t:CDS:1 n=1 Tax=Paraglomus brasilianum TaxID=144538 RepID=A0A9N9BD49_9GLOM|nr:7373_t:CDS:10 [Paraglomus brasilianum]
MNNNVNRISQQVYSGPYASVARLLLKPSSSLTSLLFVIEEFIQSEAESFTFLFDTSLQLFYIFNKVTTSVLVSKEYEHKKKIQWIKNVCDLVKNELVGFVVTAGVLRACQLVKESAREGMYRNLIAEIENFFLTGLDHAINKMDGQEEMQDVLVYLCSETIPSISYQQLAKLKSKETLLQTTLSVMLTSKRCFQNLDFITRVTSNLKSSANKDWQHLRDLEQSIMIKSMKNISKVAACLIVYLSKDDIKATIQRLYDFTARLWEEWEECPLSENSDESSAEDDIKEGLKLLWYILKILLFSVTMVCKAIFDESLIRSEVCGLHEYQHMLLLYSNVYFITSKFGLYGFSVYKIVWFGILSQLMESDDSCTFVTQQLKPSSGTTPAQKSKVAYYFLVIEQLMKVLDNNVVEEVLIYLKLYLRDKTDMHLFESAHAVMISIFANQKTIMIEIAPFYCDLLLDNYPDLLSTNQWRLTFSTMIRSLSEADDALVWYCLSRLIAKIQSIPVTTSSQAVTENDTKNKKAPSANTEETQSASLHSRSHILLILIDQIKTVNLIFLQTLLTTVKKFIGQEPDGPEKKLLLKAVFDSLSLGLDYTKKEAGVKWWLNENQELTPKL